MMSLTLLAVMTLASAPPLQLQAAIQQQSLSLPSLERRFDGLNPGAELGLEVGLWRGGRLRLVQAAGLGFFHHGGFGTSLSLRTATSLRLEPIDALELDMGLSVGYTAQLPDVPVFRAGADGFARVRAPWLHRFVAGPGLGVGWRVGAFTPFVAYHLLVEAPFMEDLSPVIPYQLVQLGVRWRFAAGEEVQ
jgi:hypothetical protein